MQYNEYDNSKRKIVSDISTLGYGKRLYSNRYFALMQILDAQYPPTKEPIFLKRKADSPKEYDRHLRLSEELDMVLENTYGMYSNFDKFLALRDSGALRLLRYLIIDENEVCVEEVGWSHKFDFAMDKMLEGDPRYKPSFFRINLMYDESSGVREYVGLLDHEKLRLYLECGGLTVSRSRMNKLTPNKSTRRSPYV